MTTGGDMAIHLRNDVVRCARCSRVWPTGCEQAVAIRKRGKCIVCLVGLGEHFSMDPYEFTSDPGYTDPQRVTSIDQHQAGEAT